jgi:hypothetical protein
MSDVAGSTISDLIDATVADYERRGASAIEDLRKKRPVAYVQLVAAISGLIEGTEPVWEERMSRNGS